MGTTTASWQSPEVAAQLNAILMRASKVLPHDSVVKLLPEACALMRESSEPSRWAASNEVADAGQA